MKIKYTSIYTGQDGTTHFREAEMDLMETVIGPLIPLLSATNPLPAEAYYLLTFPPGIFIDWHPAPSRLLHLFLKGMCEVKVSDGETRCFSAGDIVLAEDITGKGHTTRNTSSETTLMAVVSIPPSI